MVPLHIHAQNAGILISKVGDLVNIEAFELSPTNHAVMATRGRLRRLFPGAAYSLNIDTFQTSELQVVISETLEKMSCQPVMGTKPNVKKAGQFHAEERDTEHPMVVTELFMGMLRPMGKAADVSCLWKNTREEVMWLNKLLPWRRSPLWLLIRIVMQLAFSRLSKDQDLYKTFMVFLMARVLKMALQQPLPCDMIYAMNAKLARRLLKLGSRLSCPTLGVVRSIMHEASDFIHARWSTLVDRAYPRYDLSRLQRMNFGMDIFVTLPILNDYLELLAVRDRNRDLVAFRPKHTLVKYPANIIPKCPEPGGYVKYNLRALETWVDLHLASWWDHHRSKSDTCGVLGNLIRSYYRIASPIYAGNPEASSTMLLTILELWIACDRSAVHICELLKDYDPGVPSGPFESLVLPFKNQMERLLHAENYLKQRRFRAQSSVPSIFQDFGQQDCFSVRYFNQCSEQQALLQRIEMEAAQIREQKRNEFRQKQDRYKSLMRLHNESDCEYYVVHDDWGFPEQRHKSGCERCRYEAQASSLTIRIHEWPLPSSTLEAQSTVFELQVPPFFGHWRDTTIFFLFDVLEVRYSSDIVPRTQYSLQNYQALSSHFRPFGSAYRVGLLSETKPHAVTHRNEKNISITTEDQVCPNNGLHYRYYDSTLGLFTNDFHFGALIEKLPLYQLPGRSAALQRYLYRPYTAPNGPSPNTVIAGLSDCPDHMSLDEFKALCAIPLGGQIQWQNLLVQLSMPSVDFRKVETTLVILQSIYQAGPPDDDNIIRKGHRILDDETFSLGLLAKLHEASARIEENWESSQGLGIFISIATRLLDLTSVKRVKERCLGYLSFARAIALRWVDLLSDKVYKTANEFHKADLSSSLLKAALIFVDSFNVDQRVLVDLWSLSSNASSFILCSIIIQECRNTLQTDSDPTISLLLLHWRWLSYRGYPILAKQVAEGGSHSLDSAIKKFWSAFTAGDGWRVVSETSDHWLVSQTVPEINSSPLSVHFNLLTGKLLVNGLPLSRLPSEYESHPVYKTLFGRSPLEVMPTAVPGMQFSGKKDHAGYTLHFGINRRSHAQGPEGYDILVQAAQGDGRYELIPSRLLSGMFPDDFISKFVHWYELTEGYVEFRPLENPWPSSADNWRLIRTGSKWCLSRRGISLISIVSDTAVELSRILHPLEDPSRIHTSFLTSSALLEINLPRLQMSFHLKPGDTLLQSKQFRGMVVDVDQSLGTLVGLQNKLLLRHENGSRHVIIPEGSVSYVQSGHHVRVTIDKSSTAKVHPYRIDDQIGVLVDNGSMQSKLFLCYLHALTSFCLPDPLTRITGTERALSILNSAAVRSFDRLSKTNVDLLARIAGVSAERKYYPANERVMQSVHWSSELGFMAQHSGFHRSVGSIFEQAERSKIFYPDCYIQPPKLKTIDSHLLERDCLRTSTFRVSGFGAEDHTVVHDVKYEARDRDQNSTRGRRASVISSIVYHEHTALHYGVFSDAGTRLWDFLSRGTQFMGPNYPLGASELSYESNLLQDSHEFICQLWTSLHRVLAECPFADKFRLMTWLSTLAFAENANMMIVQTLAFFFTVPGMRCISAPQAESFKLSEGTKPTKAVLHGLLQSACLPVTRWPASNTPRRTGESKKTYEQRRNYEFQSRQFQTLEELSRMLESQWPCETPSYPNDLPTAFNDFVDLEKALHVVKPSFKVWFNNHHLYNYLCQIGDTLSSQGLNPVDVPSCCFDTPTYRPQMKHGFVLIDDVLSCPPPYLPPYYSISSTELLSYSTDLKSEKPHLEALIGRLQAQACSKYEESYVGYLQESLRSLQNLDKELCLRSNGDDIEKILLHNRQRCQAQVDETYGAIISAITAIDDSSAIAAKVGQWPRLSPTFLLKQLTRGRWQNVRQDWKHIIVRYGLTLTELQRAERLVSISRNHADIIRELQNPGHTNWDPMRYPESLLLEVESGIMIREVQEQIAKEMRAPGQNTNSVMQLNMGEGKSTVIVPIVAAELADGSRLVRVVVAKPQYRQMFQMLVSKLGGLLDRRVYHMPFSRALKFGEAEAHAINTLSRECMANGGVVLVQPEHILSFQLMGLECLITGKESVGRPLLKTLDFFKEFSRDIVDESDENFNVKFELIYTMGMQRPVEFGPERWIYIHRVLDLVRKFAPDVAKDFPHSMEVQERRPGGFPLTRVLQQDAQRQIFGLVAGQICRAGLDGFPLARQPQAVRKAVFRYITKTNLSQTEIAEVENQGSGGFWADTTKDILLLLRGLIAGGVLPFSFSQKRWRVNYGLDSTRKPRTKLAVPYRAKDNPTSRSEFSHPDVVIVLTSLSYYYGGLEHDDLYVALTHLLKADQPEIEYQAWIKDAPNMPPAFCQLLGINLKDPHCIEQVFPPLRYAKSVIDYFLAHIVFPKEMKEFPQKLSASGWDIGQMKTHPTTGFSGTNDSRKILPLSVKHLDIPQQKHTNALVLEYILRPENSVVSMPVRSEAYSSDAELLLAMVTKMEPPVRVILDVGAQILELTNLGVAKEWLKRMPDHDRTQAVVFFDDWDELSILDRHGNVEPFQTSSFAKQLDLCLIFLDEAHTRGTDLILPRDYRAAVTLGANLTKDRLVQGKSSDPIPVL